MQRRYEFALDYTFQTQPTTMTPYNITTMKTKCSKQYVKQEKAILPIEDNDQVRWSKSVIPTITQKHKVSHSRTHDAQEEKQLACIPLRNPDNSRERR